MMQNVRLFNVCEAKIRDIKKLMYCIIQCKLKICISILIFTIYIINQICHTTLHPAPLVTLKMIDFIWNGDVGTASETLVHNVMMIR